MYSGCVIHPRNLSNYMELNKFNNLKSNVFLLLLLLFSSKIKYYIYFILLKCNFIPMRRKECSILRYYLKKSLESFAPDNIKKKVSFIIIFVDNDGRRFHFHSERMLHSLL